MRAALFFACVVVDGLGLGCPAEDPPEPAPCPYGQVGAGDDDCRAAWADSCVDVDDAGCIADSPIRCDVDDAFAVPASDCVACGCGGTDACVDVDGAGPLCLSAAVREGERAADVIDDGLAAADYLGAFNRALAGTAVQTRAQWLADVRARRDADPRRAVVVVGSDEDNTAAALAPLFDGAFGDTVTVDDAARCDAGDVDVRAADDDGVVAVAARDAASDATCLLPGVFARCTFPSAASCAAARGLLPETVILLGARALGDVERALLSAAARAPRNQWLVRIEDQISEFDAVFLRVPGAAFAVDDVAGRVVFVADAAAAEVVYAVHVDDVAPRVLRAFRSLVADGRIDAFLTTHDIVPASCTFDVDASGDVDVVTVACAKNGARVDGDVVGIDASGIVLTAP